MKKLIAGLIAGGLMLTSVVPALAAPRPIGPPDRAWHKTYAVPGNPATLDGIGSVKAHGEGKVHYHIGSGEVTLEGKGKIAVKGSPQIQAHGFEFVREGDGWSYYKGSGKIVIKGTDYHVGAEGKFVTKAAGAGRVTFRGKWVIYYTGRNVIHEHLEELNIPIDL